MVDVYAPEGFPIIGGPETPVFPWSSGQRLAQMLAERTSEETFVVVTDGLAESVWAEVAAAILAAPGRALEVTWKRWDGRTHSPISAACIGVVSGFGEHGIAAAVAFALRSS